MPYLRKRVTHDRSNTIANGTLQGVWSIVLFICKRYVQTFIVKTNEFFTVNFLKRRCMIVEENMITHKRAAKYVNDILVCRYILPKEWMSRVETMVSIAVVLYYFVESRRNERMWLTKNVQGHAFCTKKRDPIS
jgi:hypothetical protein